MTREFVQQSPESHLSQTRAFASPLATEAVAAISQPSERSELPHERTTATASHRPEHSGEGVVTSDSADKELTAEIQKTIDRSKGLVVKMPSQESTTNADIVIGRDGSIKQFLDMNPENRDNAELTIALEPDNNSTDNPAYTIEQAQALEKIRDYAKSKGLPFDLEAARQLENDRASEIAEKMARATAGNGRAGGAVSGSGSDPGSRAQAPGHSGGYAESLPRSSDRQAGPGTACDTGYHAARQRDWTQVDITELLSEWFNADPATFKRLMPELYKRLVGPDGRLDLKKLKAMQDSKDPALDDLRKQLPLFAEMFPASASSAGVNASSEAVNPVGAKIADAAIGVANEMQGTGRCAAGVSGAIEKATGMIIFGNANDMRYSLPKHGFSEAASSELKVGQIAHVYWTPEVWAQEKAIRGEDTPNYGDIFVVGKDDSGRLMALNDNSTTLDNHLSKSRYDWSTLKVFSPPANVG